MLARGQKKIKPKLMNLLAFFQWAPEEKSIESDHLHHCDIYFSGIAVRNEELLHQYKTSLPRLEWVLFAVRYCPWFCAVHQLDLDRLHFDPFSWKQSV